MIKYIEVSVNNIVLSRVNYCKQCNKTFEGEGGCENVIFYRLFANKKGDISLCLECDDDVPQVTYNDMVGTITELNDIYLFKLNAKLTLRMDYIIYIEMCKENK